MKKWPQNFSCRSLINETPVLTTSRKCPAYEAIVKGIRVLFKFPPIHEEEIRRRGWKWMVVVESSWAFSEGEKTEASSQQSFITMRPQQQKYTFQEISKQKYYVCFGPVSNICTTTHVLARCYWRKPINYSLFKKNHSKNPHKYFWLLG